MNTVMVIIVHASTELASEHELDGGEDDDADGRQREQRRRQRHHYHHDHNHQRHGKQ